MISKEVRQKLADIGNPDRIRTMDDFVRLGRYCAMVLLAAELMTLTSLANMIFMVYAGYAPTMVSYGNTSLLEGKEGCQQYEEMKKIDPTQKLVYDAQFVSVNVEFELYCHDLRQVKDSISYQMTGVLFGAMVAGYTSDKYGRRTTLIWSLVGICLFALWVANTTSLWMFTIARFCVGLFTGALTAVQGVFVMENIPKKHRLWINTVVTWSPNFIIFPFIAYLCYTWRILSYFTSVASAFSIICLWMLEESPRWKVTVGDIAGARKSLHRINQIDKFDDPEEAEHLERMLMHEHEVRQKEQGSHQLVCLMKSQKYLLWTAKVCFGIVVASLLNYGLLFNMEKLSGSLYWNNVIFGVLRWFIQMTAGFADYMFPWFGRKMINSTAMMYIVPALIVIISIYHHQWVEYVWLARYLTIGITAMTSQLYLAKFIVSTELFPTSVRNMIASVLSMCSRCATIFSPQLFYLADIIPILPYIVMTIAAILDWILFQTLPETKGTSLPNRIPDKAEKNLLSRKQSCVEA